jgi:formylmethanofuran dehydrogenase subunit E
MALNDEQYNKIAGKLHGTRKNVYQLAEQLFGYKWDDEDFDALERKEKVFRCEDCGEWKQTSEKDSRDLGGMCTACLNGDQDDGA